MIVVFYGTSAELIKMYAVIKSVPRDQQLLICTAQQFKGLQKVHKQLDIKPDIYLAKGHGGADVSSMGQMLILMLKAHLKFFGLYASIRRIIKKADTKHSTKSIAIVHGDTLTTVAGAYLGRLLGLQVCHIEAGLRSGSWKNPFPEELDRRIVTKIARLHFTPSDLAYKNLVSEKTKGVIINTTYNTAKDAIEKSDNFASGSFKKLNLPKNYGLILLHRTELIENKQAFEAILKTLCDFAQAGNKLVFTTHSTTQEKIKQYGFENYMLGDNIVKIPKQPYFDFMTIVKNADFAVTDGGGLQEDAYFLGVPIAVHRERTERQDGLGANAVLTKMKISVLDAFLANHPPKSSFKRLKHDVSPSKVVVDYFAANNYIEL